MILRQILKYIVASVRAPLAKFTFFGAKYARPIERKSIFMWPKYGQ